MRGNVILLHGASSSGKTTLARALQARLDAPFWHYSIDHFRGTGVLPDERIARGDFAWEAMRPAFFEGFHRCLPALAHAGNALIVEHIVETPAWLSRLVHLLEGLDVFFVALRCPLPELEKRERRRRRPDFFSVTDPSTYSSRVGLGIGGAPVTTAPSPRISGGRIGVRGARR